MLARSLLRALALFALASLGPLMGCGETPEASARRMWLERESAALDEALADKAGLEEKKADLEKERTRLSARWGESAASSSLDVPEGVSVAAPPGKPQQEREVSITGPGDREDLGVVLGAVGRHPALSRAELKKIRLQEGEIEVLLVDPPPARAPAPGDDEPPPVDEPGLPYTPAWFTALQELEEEVAKKREEIGALPGEVEALERKVNAAKVAREQRIRVAGPTFAALHKLLVRGEPKVTSLQVTPAGPVRVYVAAALTGGNVQEFLAEGPLAPFTEDVAQVVPAGQDRGSFTIKLRVAPEKASP